MRYFVGPPLTEDISRQPLTVESRTQFRIGPRVVYGGQVGISTGFYGSTSIFASLSF